MEMLYDKKRVIVSELSREFDVSEETIRRDLEHLALEGNVTKTYGGAVLDEHSSIDLPFNLRQKENPDGKLKIAELVSSVVKDGDHIFLDASTTAVFIAKSIKQNKKLSVITNSIENVIELADAEDTDVYCTGGVLNSQSMSFEGSKTIELIGSLNVDKVFLSCKCFDIEGGATDGNTEIAGIKQHMIRSSSAVYLCVDSTKFDKIGFAKICELKDIDVIITDRAPTEKWMRAFEENGIEVMYP